MGTPLETHIGLNNFSIATENLAFNLMMVLKEYYLNEVLTLGNNGIESLEGREAFFAITDSEFENVVLYLKYTSFQKGSPYQILLESRDSASPSELKIYLDETLLHNLPKSMIKELKQEYDKFMED